MVARFVTVEYHRGAMDKVKSFYATTFYSNLLIGFIFSIIVLICISYIDSILEVPGTMLSDVKGMFYFVLFAGLFSSVTAVFGSTVFCLDRLDIKSVAMIFISLVRVGLLYYLLAFTEVRLIYLGIAYSVSIVLEALVYIITTLRMMPLVRFSPRDFRFSSAKTLIGSGIWNSVNQVNTILLSGLDVLMANILVSPAMAGVLGVSKAIPNQIMSLLVMLSGIFLPALTIAYSKNERDEMQNVFRNSFDLLGIFMGVMIAGVVAVGRDFFALWMPETDSDVLYALSLFGMISFWVVGTTQSIGNAALLSNKLRLPVLITFVRSAVGVMLVLALAKAFPEYGCYFIAGVSSVLTVIYDLSFTVPYASKCINIGKRFFYKAKLKFFLDAVVLSFVFVGVRQLIQPDTWISLLACVVICTVVGMLFNIFYFFDGNKRKWMFNTIKGKIVLN